MVVIIKGHHGPVPSTLPSVSSPSHRTATTSHTMPNTEGMAEAELDSMDIDTECTSSEARLSIPAREVTSVERSGENKSEEEAESSPAEGLESSQGGGRREASPKVDDWVCPAPACDNGLVSTQCWL
jgi:hypothetical protein